MLLDFVSMSNASKQSTESPSNAGLQKHRIIWGIVAAIVALSFVTFWVLNNYGTPAKPGMPDPMVPATSTEQ